jgi:peptide/nickel transport system substrate-binding protein/oligopeptide transport system substrate-binding protein
LAQIDRLAIEARHTLQMASVIGKTFLQRVLHSLATGEQQLSENLGILEKEEYILPDDPTDLGLAYTFRHILIQESAYSTLLYERRRAYHRQVAEALERLFPAQVGEQAGFLSYHYERAGDLDQAIYYYLEAADQARLLYAHDEAEALYHKVLMLLTQQKAVGVEPDPDLQAKTYLKIAQVRANALDFEGAQAFYEQAFELLEGTSVSTDRAQGDGPSARRVMQLGVYEDGPTTLDPGLSQVTELSEIIIHLFEGLVELDTELNVIPALARRWRVEQEGKKYRFELRHQLKWSDGSPLTAQDFVFAWHRNLHPKTEARLAHQLYVVEGAEAFHQGQTDDPKLIGIRATDDVTLEIDLVEPVRHFLYLLARPITFPQPAHTIEKKGVAWSRPANLVCNGPFRIADWQQGQVITLERNPLYRGFAPGNLEQAHLRFIQPTLSHYAKEEVDWCQVEDRPDLPARHPDQTFLAQYLTTFFVAFNSDFPPLNQALVRQAFAMTVNQTELVEKVWSDVQKPAMGGMIPPGMPGHSPEIGHRFDPSAAHQLLVRAGFESGADLPALTLTTLTGFSTTPAHLCESWQTYLGTKLKVLEVGYDDFASSLSQGAFQMALIGWDVEYPDPEGVLRILFHSSSPINYFQWAHKPFDNLVDQAAGAADQQERLDLYHEADRILVAEDTAIIPLYYRQAYGLLRPGFKIEGSGKIIRGGIFKLKNVSVA